MSPGREKEALTSKVSAERPQGVWSVEDYQGSIASKPRLRAAMVVAPLGTGTARNADAASSKRNAVRSLASNAVTSGWHPSSRANRLPGAAALSRSNGSW